MENRNEDEDTDIISELLFIKIDAESREEAAALEWSHTTLLLSLTSRNIGIKGGIKVKNYVNFIL